MSTEAIVTVQAHQLPLHCPTSEQALWNQHPRVFIRLIEGQPVRCPYCGTQYQLAEGAPSPGHH